MPAQHDDAAMLEGQIHPSGDMECETCKVQDFQSKWPANLDSVHQEECKPKYSLGSMQNDHTSNHHMPTPPHWLYGLQLF